MESRKPIGESFRYIDIDSIDNHTHSITSPKTTLTKSAPSRASRAVFEGSVLFSMVRPYLKNIAYISKENKDCIASTGFYVCTSNGVFVSKFLYYLMISPYVVYGLNKFMKGDNSPSINRNDIEKWLYPVPPLHEQKSIVECLEEITSRVKLIEKSLS